MDYSETIHKIYLMGERVKKDIIMIGIARFEKGNRIRGKGLCFQPGAPNLSSDSGARLLLFLQKVIIGCGDGGGRGARDARTGGGRGRSAATTTNG
jgi:hypothetical protein